ncbi:MAG: carbon-nitrogen hydrolase family protein [Promethearchaeota archaeon]
MLLKHRKINILRFDLDIYSVGDRLMVTETPIGKIGLNICADNLPNSLVFGHSLARMGAQIILSPSAWAVKANHNNMRNPYGNMWRDSYSSLAKLYNIFIIEVSNVGWIKGGPWDGRKCIGCSIVIGPNGNVLKQGSYGVDAEELITLDIELIKNKVFGTEIAVMLHKKGYSGP